MPCPYSAQKKANLDKARHLARGTDAGSSADDIGRRTLRYTDSLLVHDTPRAIAPALANARSSHKTHRVLIVAPVRKRA
jgi:hypothetical protein